MSNVTGKPMPIENDFIKFFRFGIVAEMKDQRSMTWRNRVLFVAAN
jgi:hypothetical protein